MLLLSNKLYYHSPESKAFKRKVLLVTLAVLRPDVRVVPTKNVSISLEVNQRDTILYQIQNKGDILDRPKTYLTDHNTRRVNRQKVIESLTHCKMQLILTLEQVSILVQAGRQYSVPQIHLQSVLTVPRLELRKRLVLRAITRHV